MASKLRKEGRDRQKAASKEALDSMATYYQTQIGLLKEQLAMEKESQRLRE